MSTPTAPGTYLYTDAIGGEPFPVEVVDDAGTLCARFVDEEQDEELHPIADLAGSWKEMR